MENLRTKLSHLSFHAISSALARPDLMWRGIIIGTFALLLILGVFGFLAYTWATHTAPVTLAPGTNREDITNEDIRRVLEVYSAKQSRFNELRNSAPPAPLLGASLMSFSPTSAEEASTSSTGAGILPQ